MPLILPGNVASATAAVGYNIANSCRFNSGDSPTLHRTPDASDVDKWTFSIWFKKSTVGTSAVQDFLSCIDGSGNNTVMNYVASPSNDTLNWTEYQGSYLGQYVANAKHRDPSAWYHAIFTWDSDNATAGNRMRIYINGAELTSFSTETNVSQDQDSLLNSNLRVDIGSAGGASSFFHGYFAEVIFIDGSALTPTSFGEFDSDSPTIWKPKDPSGLTFGDNGFWLDFEDSSALGNDVSGNNNDLTAVNLAAVDQATDTPTNNFCTMNPLVNTTDAAAVYSEGNTVVVTDGSSGDWGFTGTIAMTTGKWYYETRIYEDKEFLIGIHSDPAELARDSSESKESKWCYAYRGDGRMYEYDDAGSLTTNSSWGSTFTTGDIIGCYLDLDNNLIYWAKNDTLQNSGTGIAVTAPALTQHGAYWWCQTDANSGESWTITPAFGGLAAYGATAMSSVVADKNGYGSFEYDPSRGGASDFNSGAKDFYSLCTKNLAEFG